MILARSFIYVNVIIYRVNNRFSFFRVPLRMIRGVILNDGMFGEFKNQTSEYPICNNFGGGKKSLEEGYNKAVGLNEMHPVENICLSYNGSDLWRSFVTVLYVPISPHGSQSS